jgi:hypothetical protein
MKRSRKAGKRKRKGGDRESQSLPPTMKAGKVEVFRFRYFDPLIETYRYANRYATLRRIKRLRGEPIYPGKCVDAKHVTNG